MEMITALLDPDRKNWVAAWNRRLRLVLPKAYTDFIEAYGTGTYCQVLMIEEPDEGNIPLTFGDHERWNFTETFSKVDLMQAVRIAGTIDGDIICMTRDRPEHIFILPRHSEEIIQLPSFTDVLPYYISYYSYTDIACFDPFYDSQFEQLVLTKDNVLVAIDPIYQAFLETFSWDYVLRTGSQPLHVIKEIGGWITFDLVYKNSITIKYQQTYAVKALALISFIRERI
jgi:hypothetical protein